MYNLHCICSIFSLTVCSFCNIHFNIKLYVLIKYSTYRMIEYKMYIEYMLRSSVKVSGHNVLHTLYALQY